MSALFTAADGITRCSWCAASAEYIAYHDQEWGFPVADDRQLFELLSLESFQAGLSWHTILQRRAGFHAAFAGFDFDCIAGFTDADVTRLLGDSGIIRHRGKIEATINNARRARELVDATGSLAAYVWRFAPAEAATPAPPPEAIALARDLRRRGWKFLGPTTVHAFMQAAGLVNDHADGCAIRARAAQARARFQVPCA